MPPVKRWVLKCCCDINKDIAIDSIAQLTLPDIQVPLADRAFRAYVKPMEDKAFYRVELGMTPGKPVEEALEQLRKETKMYRDYFKLNL